MLVPYTTLPGWDPFVEMRRMQREMNRLFNDVGAATTPTEFPPINLWVGDGSVVVTAEISGVEQGDLDLTVHENTLTIAGKREPQYDGEKAAWHRRERAYGRFARTVQLPYRVDRDKVEARFVNGVLEVELHRPEADRPRKIAIGKA